MKLSLLTDEAEIVHSVEWLKYDLIVDSRVRMGVKASKIRGSGSIRLNTVQERCMRDSTRSSKKHFVANAIVVITAE